MKAKRLIIIGGDAAGMSAAAKAKRIDPSLEIIVFEKGEYISYAQCGLPYYISDITKDKEKLIARRPKDFEEQGISVFINHEVMKINVKHKTVEVMDQNKNTFETKYDTLLIATGADPNIPNVRGVNLKNIFTLKSISDAENIKKTVQREDIKNVVLIGGGYINVELIESMLLLGKEVRIIQRPKTLLNIMDEEFGMMLQEKVKKHGCLVHTEESLEEIIGEEKVEGVKTNKGEYKADVVIIAVGVKPRTDLLKNTGIDMLKNGAIRVDGYGKTSLPDIYAAGDCASAYHLVKKEDVYIPLATNANKQGKFTGASIAGEMKKFPGTLGSSVVKVLDMTFAKTGINEKEAKQMNIDYETVTVTAPSHARYYPNPKKIHIKLVYEKETKILLGAQMAGEEGVAKRLDIFALAIDRKMTGEELGYIDFCYSPPYATPWDAVHIAANNIK
ncbi:CoA-disulfide reductase [Inediibacterium massiliense]|uniref:CoA-disulfide reductase n=1 Tax=Inediibacterium massiliense TaxID=1658111 RepID=UPI0006B6878F|nr:CoA-disulfide reductase [Inediibacterium massiliense]